MLDVDPRENRGVAMPPPVRCHPAVSSPALDVLHSLRGKETGACERASEQGLEPRHIQFPTNDRSGASVFLGSIPSSRASHPPGFHPSPWRILIVLVTSRPRCSRKKEGETCKIAVRSTVHTRSGMLRETRVRTKPSILAIEAIQ
ncbi:hypothetical protein PUN28_012675 [Cardiocondyla obscurior]|uniref:Uncharacterized protein n=1 Tax=Cardiocondyla obscurior TaxID=286306 RepID=A0AAW2FI16_9HYME